MKKVNFNNQYYADPLVLFAEWFEQAKVKELNDPNAMNLATISKKNIHSSRIVLLKSFTIFVIAFSIGILSILDAPTKPLQSVLE